MRKNDHIYEEKKTELIVKMFDILIDRLETLWILTNPKAGTKLLESRKNSKISKDDTEITAENFSEEWAKIMGIMPATIERPTELSLQRSSLPKFSKNALRNKVTGIQVNPSK